MTRRISKTHAIEQGLLQGDAAARRRAAHEREDARLQAAKAKTRATETVAVDNPYGNGRDAAVRVVDTLTHLVQRGHIGKAEAAAGDRVRAACERAPMAVRCALAAPEGHGSATNRSPSEAQLDAAGDLNDVYRFLGELDGALVIRVAGMGMGLEDVARVMFAVPDGRRVARHLVKHVGQRLRLALKHLVRRWSPRASGRRAMRAEAGERLGVLSERECAGGARKRTKAGTRRRKTPAGS